MKQLIQILAGLLICTNLFAQKQAENWIFGLNAGLNFAGTTPVVIPSVCTTTEGTTVSSDANGALNFYSDGVSIWDKTGTVMPNGSGLFGSVSSTVSALTVPHPGNGNLHYVFTLDEATGTNGFCYSLVDMSLNQGNGDVTLKNVPIQSNVTEKMTAVKQQGTNNIWVTVHEWGSNAFYSYLITAAGLQITPVVSNAGMIHTIDPLEQNKYGQMKFNPCGTKIALAIGYLDTVQVLDFDPVTGLFSNPITLPLGDHVYGVEFSQNSSMLYVTRYNTGVGYADLVQFDLTSGVESTIISSMNIIHSNTTGTNFYYALQLALDEKIYVCLSWSPFLGVINDPDNVGAASNYDPMGCDLDPNFVGASSGLGLPAFIQSYFNGEIDCDITGIEELLIDAVITSTISSHQFVLVNNSNQKSISIMVYDIAGRIMEKTSDFSGSAFYFGENLPAGVYSVAVNSNDKSGRFRIIKL